MTLRIRLGLLGAAALVAASCGGSDDAAQKPDVSAYGAQVASYDLAADRPQRFLVGLIGTDRSTLVGGELDLSFAYVGSGPTGSDTGELVPEIDGVVAQFIPVAGGQAPPSGDGPRARMGDEGVGVYEATGVSFSRPGNWEVTVRADVAGSPVEVAAAFEVLPEHQIVTAGDAAPRTVNLLPGSSEAAPAAIDSRAEDDGSVPDPELHELTVADAIATGKPTIVVVSTPVFCVSRFCGPITDSIQAMAGEFGDRANFVHLEVWNNFENNAVNRAAAEWIYPDADVEASEPWVFLIDGTGTVVQRWDNVANQAAVASALSALL